MASRRPRPLRTREEKTVKIEMAREPKERDFLILNCVANPASAESAGGKGGERGGEECCVPR